MKREGGRRELMVGITLTLALVLFAGIVTMLGEQTRLLHSRATYTTKVSNSLGLKAGSPVVMSGVQIGTVLSVDLPRQAGAEGIDLELSVNRAYSDRIREDSQAGVGFITLLSGEKFVEIIPGDPAKATLPDGSFIPPSKSESIFEAGQNLADNVGAVTDEFKQILEKINRGEGLLGQIVNQRDPYFGKDVVDRMQVTLERTNGILDRIDKGQGAVGRLISDREYADATLGSIRSAAERLDRVMALIESENGTANALLKPEGEGREVIANLKAATASLRATSERLEAKTGLLGRLLNDPAYSEAVATDLHTISQSLASILGKIDKGEGTLGGLINDPSVYEGLQNIVKGINSSKMAKGMLRHYGKKGAEIEPAPPATEPATPKPEPATPKPEPPANPEESQAPE